MPLVNPSIRAPLVTSPAMPPIAATFPPDGSRVTSCAPAFSPAETLLVPMYVAGVAFAAFAALTSTGSRC
jgi:hypothetical protein